jgi:hypothetical protein
MVWSVTNGAGVSFWAGKYADNSDAFEPMGLAFKRK